MLGFERRPCIVHGRRVRNSIFESRSSLPVSAACLVANAVRQTLGSLLGTGVSLRLLEPVLPDGAGWRCIGSDAQIFSMRGESADAAFVVRRPDALALAAAAFGECVTSSRELSAIEADLVRRIMKILCGSLAPLCGARENAGISQPNTLDGYLTYFEIIVEEPVDARIGVAISREAAALAVPELQAADLGGVELDLVVEIAYGSLPAPAIVSLRAGEMVKLESPLGSHALLRSGNVVLARGECGEMKGRAVVAIQ